MLLVRQWISEKGAPLDNDLDFRGSVADRSQLNKPASELGIRIEIVLSCAHRGGLVSGVAGRRIVLLGAVCTPTMRTLLRSRHHTNHVYPRNAPDTLEPELFGQGLSLLGSGGGQNVGIARNAAQTVSLGDS